MNDIKVLEVALAGERIGKLALTPENLCAFEYDANYLQNGVSISPYYLPLKAQVFIAKRGPFAGNFGVFDDSLPDGWGNLILDRYLKEKGINPYQLTILQRLSLIGKAGRGALEYYPDNSVIEDADYLELNKIAEDAEKLLNSDEYTSGSLEALYRHGGSSGGARPKVFLKIDNEEWMVKFKAGIDPKNVGEIEYNYSVLARQCGLIMPETKLFEGKYFGVKRFDRENGIKCHVISVAGLVNADYRLPSLDYEGLLTICLNLTRDMEEVYKMYRLMVFNVLIGNKDDHAKNFSFILKHKEWKLSPAYDILPNEGFNGYHTTTINGKGNPTKEDIFAVAKKVGLDVSKCKLIYEEIADKIVCFKTNETH